MSSILSMQMSSALSGLEQNISVTQIVQTVVSGRISHTETALSFNGVITNVNLGVGRGDDPTRQIQGVEVYTRNLLLTLELDDRITYNAKTYIVDNITDYQDYGFRKYQFSEIKR